MLSTTSCTHTSTITKAQQEFYHSLSHSVADTKPPPPLAPPKQNESHRLDPDDLAEVVQRMWSCVSLVGASHLMEPSSSSSAHILQRCWLKADSILPMVVKEHQQEPHELAVLTVEIAI